jgi:peptidoglycan/LPS O-acetylase OafA/YrhL
LTIESTTVPAADATTAPAGRAGLRLNNIAELRLLFAACVVLSHAVQLARARDFDLIRVVLNSEVAVQGFFILSGYLVFGSYERIHDALSFYRRRIARIYPAYFVAVVLFLGLVLLQAHLLGARFAWSEVGRYLAANLTTLNFLKPSIGGVFDGNAAQAVNGALWSIKVELMFYALVPVFFAIAERTSFIAVSVALIVAGIVWWPLLAAVGAHTGIGVPEELRNQLPGQLQFFGLGIALFAFSRGKLGLLGLSAIVAMALVLLVILADLRSAANVLGLVTVIGFLSSARSMNSVFSKTDISYGIYLCHFPIIQMLLASGAAAWPFGAYLGVILVVVPVYGLLSWNLIERPSLELNKRWTR